MLRRRAAMNAESAGAVAAARMLAEQLLADLPDRLQHSRCVALRAAELSAVAAHQEHLLIAAAWLHDIGYAPPLRDTGFHPLDGANYLTGHGITTAVADLVAHHSGARFVAEVRGLSEPLARYRFEQNELTDALTYADQTIGPDGGRIALADRIAEVLTRHGPDSPNVRARARREPYLYAAAARVEQRLAGPNASGQGLGPG